MRYRTLQVALALSSSHARMFILVIHDFCSVAR